MSLLIATPCYGGMATEAYMSSCDVLRQAFVAGGYPHDILRLTKESLITRARNVCASSFLFETEFDILGFIDADIEFSVDDVALAVQRVVECRDPIAVGAYRNKSIDAPLAVWKDSQLIDLKDIKEPTTIDFAGTGFMFIHRRVFEKMMKVHPEWEYDEGMPLETWNGERGKCWAFFQDPIVEWTDGSRYHQSEDYFFCEQARELGFEVTVHPDIKLKHWGSHAY